MARPKVQSVKPSRVAPFRNTFPEIVAEWCAISVETAKHFLSGRRRPSPPVRKLYDLYREGKVLGPEWEGWRIKGDRLLDPHGNEMSIQLLEHWQLVCQLAHAKAPEAYNQLLDRWSRRNVS